jgi:predicted glycosyltransferase
VHRLRATIAAGAAETFAPDVAVVDKTPFGLGGELRPALEALRTRSCRLVLGLRDIEDAPERVRRAWGAAGLREEVERLYDALLVFGPASEHDVLACLGWEDVALPVHHVGYVGRDPALERPADLPREYLLATVGGGADGFPLQSTLVQALRERPLALPTVLVTGPLMPAAEVEALRLAAAGLAVDVQEFRPDMEQVVGAARAAVAMAGYNTVGELLRAGTPALLVPRTRPSAEQLIRARDLEARGLVHVLTPDEADAPTLRAALDRLLARPRSAPQGTWDGARRAALVLGELAAARRGGTDLDLAAAASA